MVQYHPISATLFSEYLLKYCKIPNSENCSEDLFLSESGFSDVFRSEFRRRSDSDGISDKNTSEPKSEGATKLIEVELSFAFHIIIVLVCNVLIVVVSRKVYAKSITLFLFRILVIYIRWIDDIHATKNIRNLFDI